MYRYFLVAILSVVVLFLNACNQQPLKQQVTDETSKGDHYLPLSTKQNEQEQIDEKTEEPSVNIQEISPEPGYAVPQEQPAEQIHLLESSKQDEQQLEQVHHLPFADFKERWNALSEEQGSSLTITQLNKTVHNEKTVYHTSLPNQLTMDIFSANEYIQKIQLIGKGKTASELYAMLAGWSQIFYLSHPGTEPHHVDDLFNELGVGPNADMKEVTEKTVMYRGVHYTVSLTEAGYQFEALYPDV